MSDPRDQALALARSLADTLEEEFTALKARDIAQVERNDPQPGERVRTTLSGVGAGLRATWPNRLSLRADTGVVVRGEGYAQPGDAFVHMAMSYGF